MDLSMLNTLPDNEILNGTAEIVKHGLTLNHHLYDEIGDNIDKWQQRDPDFFLKIIIESCKVKKKIVEADLREDGIRRILNFGHTIGHAIEALEEYHISHGAAIAIGMVVESLIGQKMGHLKEEQFDEIYNLFKTLGFPLVLSDKVTTDGMINAMKYDKKAQEGTPRFVILDGVGKVCSFKGDYVTAVDEPLLREALGWMINEISY